MRQSIAFFIEIDFDAAFEIVSQAWKHRDRPIIWWFLAFKIGIMIISMAIEFGRYVATNRSFCLSSASIIIDVVSKD